MDEQQQRGERNWKQARPIARIVGAGVAGLIALTVLLGSFYTVDAGTMAVHTRFGSVVGVSGPGLHFKMPWFDDVTHISVRTETVDWSRAQDGTDHDALTLDDGTCALTGNFCKVRIPPGRVRNQWVRLRVRCDETGLLGVPLPFPPEPPARGHTGDRSEPDGA